MTIVVEQQGAVPILPAPLKDRTRSVSHVSCMTAETDACESSMSDSESTADLDDLASEDPTEELPAEPFRLMKRMSEPTIRRMRRRSILKRSNEEIPVKSRGWKNLPKPDINMIRQKSAPLLGRDETRSDRLNLQVRFLDVQIRCYDLCIGDNPAVSYGTPISLDWAFEQMEPIDLDAFEGTRDGKRRKPRQMMMNYYTRRNLLTYTFGYTEEELNAAEKAANRVRNQRALTKALLPTMMIEDFMGSAARKTKRMIKKKHPKTGVLEWERPPSSEEPSLESLKPTSSADSAVDRSSSPKTKEPTDGPFVDDDLEI